MILFVSYEKLKDLNFLILIKSKNKIILNKLKKIS